jgi:lycopene cyclase domain-containing protein
MTYATLALTFLAVPVLLTVVAAVVARPSRRWWAAGASTLAVLLVLTAVFDSLMIAADLFRFDEDQLLGARVGRAPVEDFAWPVAAVLTLPSLWLLLGRPTRRAVGAQSRAGS